MCTGAVVELRLSILVSMCLSVCAWMYTTICVVPKEGMERCTGEVGEKRGR